MACVWFSCEEADNTLEFQRLYYHATAQGRINCFIKEAINAAVNKEKKNYLFTKEKQLSKVLDQSGIKLDS
jgi:rRNA-processing protein FCF1